MDPLKLINGDADVALAGRTQHLAATTMKSPIADHHPQLEHGGGALQTGIKPKPDQKHLNLATSIHGRGPSPATTPAIAGEGRERGQSAQIWRGTRRTGVGIRAVQEESAPAFTRVNFEPTKYGYFPIMPASGVDRIWRRYTRQLSLIVVLLYNYQA
jgi:hypothetical protein